jgi:choline dehydrogenase-like flavoprotein
MAIDSKKYFEELMESAGVSDETAKQAILNFASNEKVSKRLSDDVLRQQDYSRNMDALTAEKNKWGNWYQEALTTFNKNERAMEQTLREKAAYEAMYGPLNGQQTVQQPVIQPVQQDFISKKDFEAELTRREQQTLGLFQKGLNISTRHLYEFKEPLDTDALVKSAVEKQIPLEQAYEQMVAPRRTELAQKKYADDLAKAREDGARDFASKHKLPVDNRAREPHILLDRPEKPVVEYTQNSGVLSGQARRTLRDNFAADWNKAESPETSGT